MARMKDVIKDLNKVPRCALCGSRSADGVWMGRKTMGVCLPCAVEVLPKLIADGVMNRLCVGRDDAEHLVHEQWRIVRANFYEAAFRNSCRLMREWEDSHAGRLN